MPTFRDTRTGQLIEAHSRARTVFFRQQERYEEVRVGVEVEEGHTGFIDGDYAAATNEVPVGTVVEVLEWVGDNPARRAAALEVERAGKNRKTVIEALT